MIKAKCLQCGTKLRINAAGGGEGYFFGYDTDHYGLGLDDQRDPHEVIGYYCRECGDALRAKAEQIGSTRTG